MVWWGPASSAAPQADGGRRVPCCVCSVRQGLPESEESDGARGGVHHTLGMGSPCGHPSAHTAQLQPAPAGKKQFGIYSCNHRTPEQGPALWIPIAQPPGTARYGGCAHLFQALWEQKAGRWMRGSPAERGSTVGMRGAFKCCKLQLSRERDVRSPHAQGGLGPKAPLWPFRFQMTPAPSPDSPVWGLISLHWTSGLVVQDGHMHCQPAHSSIPQEWPGPKAARTAF